MTLCEMFGETVLKSEYMKSLLTQSDVKACRLRLKCKESKWFRDSNRLWANEHEKQGFYRGKKGSDEAEMRDRTRIA